MTDQTQTPAAIVETPDVTWNAFAFDGAPIVATFGGRKRKGDKPAFAKTERKIQWADLPDESKVFLFRYGFIQYLADGANTSADDAEFNADLDERRRKLVEADFAVTRDGPAATNDPEVLATQLARAEVAKVIRDAKATVTKEQRESAIVAYRAANLERLMAEAVRQIESRKAAAASVDLNTLLGLGQAVADATGQAVTIPAPIELRTPEARNAVAAELQAKLDAAQ